MNIYATLDSLKTDIGISGTSNDDILTIYLESASRAIDKYTKRHFYSETATRFETAMRRDRLMLTDDLLSITTLTTDSELDGTYDGETWAEATDFWMAPYNVFPKTELHLTDFGNYTFSHRPRNVKIVGVWGYADSASPWDSISETATTADATTTTVTMSADVSSVIYPTQTILVGSEQMYVSAVSTTTLTVTRAVNGTTAATHAGAATSTAVYPHGIEHACRWMAHYEWKQRGTQGKQQEKIGDYFYTRALGDYDKTTANLLGGYTKVTS